MMCSIVHRIHILYIVGQLSSESCDSYIAITHFNEVCVNCKGMPMSL